MAEYIIPDDVKKMKLEKEDTLVLRFKPKISSIQADFVRREMKKLYPETKLLILDQDTDISVVSEKIP